MEVNETVVKNKLFPRLLIKRWFYLLLLLIIVVNSTAISEWFSISWIVLFKLQIVTTVLTVESVNLLCWILGELW
jgi:hypothetical protein